MSQQPIRIGARASKLSLAQTRTLQVRIAAALGVSEADMESAAVIVPITTTGDRVQDRRLMEIGGKALFTKEIEEALLDGRIDCAVHSLKDVPAENPDGLVLAAIPKREDARDAYLSEHFSSVDALPIGAKLGTASLRRQAQMLHRRPDLEIVMLRGNVDTRLAKLARGEADAILLAASGLNRLGLGHLPREFIDPIEAPPAPGQGALAVQTRTAEVDALWVRALRDEPTTLCVAAERGALYALEGSCRTAVGAYARLAGTRLSLVVEALTPDGAKRFRREGDLDLPAQDAEAAARALGVALGRAVREEGGEALVL